MSKSVGNRKRAGGQGMLGGSFWIAFLRNGIGAALVMAVFLLLDCPRFSMKKTILYYAVGGVFFNIIFSVWYLGNAENFVQFSGLAVLLCLGTFCALMSREGIYLALYKICFGFYLLSLVVFIGVDTARLWFDGNMGVDILIRFLLTAFVLIGVKRKLRVVLRENVDYLREEMDLFSAVTLVGSSLLAASSAYWPSFHIFSVENIVRMFMIMLMAGIIQYLILYLYIHLGKEHSYEKENQLLEMNEQFLRRQLELEEEAQEEAARLRHDIRHHCRLIEEYIKNGETEALLKYVQQYSQDAGRKTEEPICRNTAVNSILSVYGRYAGNEKICVNMDVAIADSLKIRDIDLVAILANIFEYAISGCLGSRKQQQEIDIRIAQKGHKIVIRCRNTCAEQMRLHKGVPVMDGDSGLGIASIVKTAARYEGETDFSVENGMFVARVLLNLPA